MRSRRAHVTASDELIARLAGLEQPTPTIVSGYLQLDQAARRNGAYRVEFLNRVRDLENRLAALDLPPKDRAAIDADVHRMTRWVAQPENLPHLAGVAVFACRAIGLFEVVPLPRVHRNRLDVDTRPLIAELLDARETLGHYLAVVVDRRRARFFHVAAAGTQELNALIPLSRRSRRFHPDVGDAPGWGERHYHQRLVTETTRHYAAIAREIDRLMAARPYRGIAVFGPKVHAVALTKFLSPRLGAIQIGARRLSPTEVTAAEVAKATWSLEWEAERRAETDLLDAIDSGVPTGWAVNGARETLRALARGQVRQLVVPDGMDGAGFRCRDTGQLTLSQADCRGAGAPIPVPHLVDHAIEDALRQCVDVVVIDDRDAAARVDGLAATLRFRSR